MCRVLKRSTDSVSEKERWRKMFKKSTQSRSRHNRTRALHSSNSCLIGGGKGAQLALILFRCSPERDRSASSSRWSGDDSCWFLESTCREGCRKPRSSSAHPEAIPLRLEFMEKFSQNVRMFVQRTGKTPGSCCERTNHLDCIANSIFNRHDDLFQGREHSASSQWYHITHRDAQDGVHHREASRRFTEQHKSAEREIIRPVQFNRP
ncbi:hypothetical protein RRG08_008513 [Elysia crispata]|uniref:Uncharacterized protein n=1 Tax=Elysia crispata TaxID=231223 RepID=A0AAE0Z9S2_9GAST|nr:hypothetical protein RRG08_008513 [Elysia crispata]